jgi:hypothetical protein
MSYVKASTIMDAVKTVLAAIALPDGEPGEKLFERVEFHENKNLGEAMRDLVIVKQRVAFIVPGGFGYANFKEGRTVRSARTFTFDLLFADRAYTKGGHDAVFGGAKNVGVLEMQELVVDALAANPQLITGDPAAALPYVVLTATEGAPLNLKLDEKDSAGRECYAQGYETPAGEIVLTPTAPAPR